MDIKYLNFNMDRFSNKNHIYMRDMMRREFVYNIIHDNIISIFDVEKYNKMLDIVHFPTVVFVAHVDGKAGEKVNKEIFKIRSKIVFDKLQHHLDSANDGLVAILGRNNINAVITGDREIVILLPIVEEDGKKQVMLSKRYAEYLKVIMERHITFTLSIGIGNNYNDLKRLSMSYQEASEALKYKFYTGNSSIIHYTDIDVYREGNLRFFVENETRVVQGIRKNKPKQVINSIKELFSYIERQNRVSPDILKIRLMALLTVISRTAIDLGVGHELMLSLKARVGNEIEAQTTLEEMRGWLLGIVEEILETINSIKQDSTVKMVNKARSYIEENHFKNISLEEVSRHVNISPFYLSRIFKEVKGVSFTDYLTRIRIKKAQNMLMSTDMTVSEISRLVGYRDANYFSRIFKKVVGESPLQFRKGEKA